MRSFRYDRKLAEYHSNQCKYAIKQIIPPFGFFLLTEHPSFLFITFWFFFEVLQASYGYVGYIYRILRGAPQNEKT
jgi:hypothetical protein